MRFFFLLCIIISGFFVSSLTSCSSLGISATLGVLLVVNSKTPTWIQTSTRMYLKYCLDRIRRRKDILLYFYFGELKFLFSSSLFYFNSLFFMSQLLYHFTYIWLLLLLFDHMAKGFCFCSRIVSDFSSISAATIDFYCFSRLLLAFVLGAFFMTIGGKSF